MLRKGLIFVIVTVGYLLITFFTGTYEAYIDGEDKVGFPLDLLYKNGRKTCQP
ncbi:MAG TPA: hypothetical protein VF421_00315 [Niabella sp.]